MARKRMIDPNIWQSEDFAKLGTLARLVFIGLFSNADDEGRGRAKPVYIKSILFPYDETLRVTDIEKSLNEIAASMSITFYTHGENEYYSLRHWTMWQRVDKPQPSKIPSPKGCAVIRGSISDEAGSDRKAVSPKRIEEKKTEEKKKERERDFRPPDAGEVKEYCAQRKNSVDAEAFVDFYESKGWMIGKNRMRDWKAAVRSWERKAQDRKKEDKRAFAQREYTEEDRRRRNAEAWNELEQLYGKGGKGK